MFDSQDWIKMWLMNRIFRISCRLSFGPLPFKRLFFFFFIWHHPVHSQVFTSWTGQKWWSQLSKLFKQEKNWQNLYNKPFGVCRPCRNFLCISAFQIAEERLKHGNCVLILTGKQCHKVVWGVLFMTRGSESTRIESVVHFAELLSSVSSFFFLASFIDAAQGLISTGSY